MALSSASDIRAKISSSVGAGGVGAGGVGVGGGGGAGGGCWVTTGGAGAGGGATGGFFPHAPPRTKAAARDSDRIFEAFLGISSPA